MSQLCSRNRRILFIFNVSLILCRDSASFPLHIFPSSQAAPPPSSSSQFFYIRRSGASPPDQDVVFKKT